MISRRSFSVSVRQIQVGRCIQTDEYKIADWPFIFLAVSTHSFFLACLFSFSLSRPIFAGAYKTKQDKASRKTSRWEDLLEGGRFFDTLLLRDCPTDWREFIKHSPFQDTRSIRDSFGDSWRIHWFSDHHGIRIWLDPHRDCWKSIETMGWAGGGGRGWGKDSQTGGILRGSSRIIIELPGGFSVDFRPILSGDT